MLLSRLFLTILFLWFYLTTEIVSFPTLLTKTLVTNDQHTVVPIRIVSALVTKKLKQLKVRDFPLHQTDLASLVGEVVGHQSYVAWIGQNPLTARNGTPWVKRKGRQAAYGTKECFCLTKPGHSTRWWAPPSQEDPLFNANSKGRTDLFFARLRSGKWGCHLS